MDIDSRIRELGPVDSGPLAAAILAQEEATWHEQQHRQRAYEVHRDTESMVLVFTEESAWPELVVKKEAAWERLAEVAMPAMHDIIGRYYPGRRHDHPGHGGQTEGRRQDHAAHRPSPFIPHRPPDSRTHYHQPPGAVHHQWTALPVGRKNLDPGWVSPFGGCPLFGGGGRPLFGWVSPFCPPFWVGVPFLPFLSRVGVPFLI